MVNSFLCELLSSSISMFECNETSNILHVVSKMYWDRFLVILWISKLSNLDSSMIYYSLLNLGKVNSKTVIQNIYWWNVNDNHSYMLYLGYRLSLLPLFWILDRVILLKKWLFLKAPSRNICFWKCLLSSLEVFGCEDNSWGFHLNNKSGFLEFCCCYFVLFCDLILLSK